MNEGNETTATPLTAEMIEQLKALLTAAGDIACPRIRELAGADFLAKLLADQADEIIVQVALKRGLVRINVNCDGMTPPLQTVCELVVDRDRTRAQ
jgi:hypothetical protein